MFYFILFLFAIAGSALVVLTIENLTTQVQFAVFTWQSPNLPLGIVVLAAFILGALLLYIVSALSALRDRNEKKHLRKQVSELEQRIAAMTPAVPQQDQQTSSSSNVPMPGLPPQ